MLHTVLLRNKHRHILCATCSVNPNREVSGYVLHTRICQEENGSLDLATYVRKHPYTLQSSDSFLCFKSCKRHTRTCRHTHIRTYPHSHIQTYTQTHIPRYPYTHIPTHTYTHILSYTHTHIYTYPHTHIPTLHTYTYTHIQT